MDTIFGLFYLFVFKQASSLIFLFLYNTNTHQISSLVGGLLVAATIKYADNILKGFATSLTIIVSSAGSQLILREIVIGPYFNHGCILVLLSTILYSFKIDLQKYSHC